MNKYEIVGIVGEGAYGIVYKAKNKETGEFVAIKKFKENTEEDEVVKKTTMREVKMLRLLKHENIVLLREAFKRKGKLYLVFEFVEKTLLEVLDQRRSLDGETVRKFMYQLLRAISYIHALGVIHRDIKPENLLISEQNILKLCDFGFARNLPQQTHGKAVALTDYVATRWYRSPELLLGDNYSKEVDIWAIGCIMGELTDGDALFPGESEVDQLYCIQKILGALTYEQQDKFQKNPRFLGYKFPDVTKPETLEKRYVGKLSKQALNLMEGLLRMDPSERLTAKEAMYHPYFDGLRSSSEEQSCQEYRSSQVNLRRQESATNAGRNQESSRSRSGLRNNVGGVIKGVTGAAQNFSQQQRRFMQNQQENENKSKSQGRKNDQKSILGTGALAFQNMKNNRDSSLSSHNPQQNNNSVSAYTSSNFNHAMSNNKFQAAQNNKNTSLYGQFGDMINGMGSGSGVIPGNQGQPLGSQSSMHHSSTSQFTMNNFMPSNLTSALYNQVTSGAKMQSEYSYDINLQQMNKSVNEQTYDQAGSTKLIQGLYYQNQKQQNTQEQPVIQEADEESYYQNESPSPTANNQRGRKMLQPQQNNILNNIVDQRQQQQFSQSPTSHTNNKPIFNGNVNGNSSTYYKIPLPQQNQQQQQQQQLKESSAFMKLNTKMKQKRSNQQQQMYGAREGSSEPNDNYHQRVDTGGGEYLQIDEGDGVITGNVLMPYQNNKFSPKASGMNSNNNKNKKRQSQQQIVDEWNINRQGSKKGIQNQFLTNKLTYNNQNTQQLPKEYDYNIPSASLQNTTSNQYQVGMAFSKESILEQQQQRMQQKKQQQQMLVLGDEISPHSSKHDLNAMNTQGVNNVYRQQKGRF